MGRFEHTPVFEHTPTGSHSPRPAHWASETQTFDMSKRHTESGSHLPCQPSFTGQSPSLWHTREVSFEQAMTSLEKSTRSKGWYWSVESWSWKRNSR